MENNNSKRLKFTKESIIMIASVMVIPAIIIGISGIYPKDITTGVFFVIALALYIYSILVISKIYIVKKQLEDIVEEVESESISDNEEKLNLLSSILEEGQESKYKYIYNIFSDYKKTFRKIKVETITGEEKRKLYSTVDAEYFFSEENLIHKNIYYKTVNNITQALTGIGIFGTFLGIVDGIGSLNTENTEAMKLGINKLLSGVSVSFSTSLYGILFSLILTFILKLSIELTMKKSDNFVSLLNKIVQNSSDKEGLQELEWELKKQTSSLEKLATDLAEEMGKKFDTSMQENLAKLTSDMSFFIEKIGHNFSNAIMENSMSTSVALTSNIKPLMESLEATMNNIQKHQENSSMKFIEESMSAMKEAVKVGTNDEITKLKESMDAISSKNSELVDTFNTSMENMKQLTLHQESLIKNTTTSTESMNVTTENIKELQSSLSTVIQSLNNVSTTNNVSLENIQSTVESLKSSMIEQANTSRIIENMVNKSYDLSLAQDEYINKFNSITRTMESSLQNTEKYIQTINSGISSYKDKFEFIQLSTINAIDSIDTRYKSIVTDLEKANYNLSNTIESVDKNILIKINNVMNDLADYQEKASMMTNKLEKFVEVEEETQYLWSNYKDSFNKLNTTITDGVENYTKNVHKGVSEMLIQYDASIADTVNSLNKIASLLNETAETISENIEDLADVMQQRA